MTLYFYDDRNPDYGHDESIYNRHEDPVESLLAIDVDAPREDWGGECFWFLDAESAEAFGRNSWGDITKENTNG